MKKIISLILALCLMFTAFSVMAESKWTNASDWAKPELEKAIEAGVYPKALENKDLTQNITRAEQASLTVKIYEAVTGKTVEAGENPFTDTNDVEIVKAFRLGITSGTTATTFSPDDNLTREQAAAMLARVFKKIKNTDTLSFEMPQQFADHSKISDYAIESVYFMNAQGYIKGTDAGFDPQSQCSREQALAIAQRMANNLKSEKPAEPAKETFKVVFIGGSLTEGGNAWHLKVINYLKEKMPEKKVEFVNSGIGGTTSEYGAKRYAKDVLAYNPDLVVIEFAVNDRSYGSKEPLKHQTYMEAMVQQSLKVEKVPAIMFLYSNHAYEGTDLENVEFSRKSKEELARFYKIPSVDAHAYCVGLYEADKEKTSTSYKEWLEEEKNYYPRDNVHPYASGYQLFGDAIVEAFEKEGLEKFLKPVQPQNGLFCFSENQKVMSRYEYVYVTNPKIAYNGKWYLCNKDMTRQDLPDAILPKFFQHPYCPEGGVYTNVADSTMSFKTSASEIFISYVSGSATSDMVILIDGKETQTLSTASSYTNMNYVSKGISGVKGKTVTIKSKSNAPLKILAIIERYNQ